MKSPERSAQTVRRAIAILFFCISFSSSLISQVTIREKISINPSPRNSVVLSIGEPVSTSFLIAPSDGTMQIWFLDATQAESTIPSNARLIVSTPLGQLIDSIWNYCSNRYSGDWHSGWGYFSNSCTNHPVKVNEFSTRDSYDRTPFFPVHEGDTLRFTYWSNAWADSCKGFSGSGPNWNLYLFKSGRCYICDSIGLNVYLTYADSGFAQLSVNPLRDTLIYGVPLQLKLDL